MNVDVAINVYGKPYQTALTLASLRANSRRHIGRIFYQEEAAQPHGADVSRVPKLFPDMEIVHRVSALPLGVEITDRTRLHLDHYRHSIRYQFAWEASQADFLFVTHNDCLFDDDVIGAMLDRAAMEQDVAGIGWIGQCWNCPASFAGVCDGRWQERYRPTYEEAVAVVKQYPGIRTSVSAIDRAAPMPFPECRLNEFACLINLRLLRPVVAPHGPIVPLGSFFVDTGTQWFRELQLAGFHFANYFPHTHHAPFSQNAAGHTGNSNKFLYDLSEQRARDYLQAHHPALLKRMEPEHTKPMLTADELKPHLSWEMAATLHELIRQNGGKPAYDQFVAATGGALAYAVTILKDPAMRDFFVNRFEETARTLKYRDG